MDNVIFYTVLTIVNLFCLSLSITNPFAWVGLVWCVIFGAQEVSKLGGQSNVK